MTEEAPEKPPAPELPKYLREPLEKQSPERLETIAGYAQELAEWKRQQRQAELERRRAEDEVDKDQLEELNPSVSEATVYKHIQKLIDAGIVREVALDDDQRRQGYPWNLYGLTEEGCEFLDAHNLLAAEETLQQIYNTISDKPEKMVKYENAPRPDGV